MGSCKHSHGLLKCLPAHPDGLAAGGNPHSRRLVEVNEGANYPHPLQPIRAPPGEPQTAQHGEVAVVSELESLKG